MPLNQDELRKEVLKGRARVGGNLKQLYNINKEGLKKAWQMRRRFPELEKRWEELDDREKLLILL